MSAGTRCQCVDFPVVKVPHVAAQVLAVPRRECWHTEGPQQARAQQQILESAVRNRQQQAPADRQDAGELAQRCIRIVHVLKDGIAHDDVVAAICKRQAAEVRPDQVAMGPNSTCARQPVFVCIDAHGYRNLRRRSIEELCKPPVTAPRIEPPPNRLSAHRLAYERGFSRPVQRHPPLCPIKTARGVAKGLGCNTHGKQTLDDCRGSVRRWLLTRFNIVWGDASHAAPQDATV